MENVYRFILHKHSKLMLYFRLQMPEEPVPKDGLNGGAYVSRMYMQTSNDKTESSNGNFAKIL